MIHSISLYNASLTHQVYASTIHQHISNPFIWYNLHPPEIVISGINSESSTEKQFTEKDVTDENNCISFVTLYFDDKPNVGCSFFKLPYLLPSDSEVNIGSSPFLLGKSLSKELDCAMKRESSAVKFINTLPDLTRFQFSKINFIQQVSENVIKSKKVNLPINSQHKNTVMFDLDETLILSKLSEKENSEMVYCNGEMFYVTIRPFAQQLLVDISKHFEIIIFTASNKEYADKIINMLDPHKLVSYRLYRENCVVSDKYVVKDLRILNRNLKNIVLVDNSVICMAPQPENGILVKSYSGDPLDDELIKIRNFLVENADIDDLREKVSNVFKIKQLAEICKSIY